MHNLSGVYVHELNKVELNSSTYFQFSIIFPKKTREYFIDNEEDYKNWVKNIIESVGLLDLNSKYEVIVIKSINKG